MSDVTRILSASEQGDRHAAERLLPFVYEELRQLAASGCKVIQVEEPTLHFMARYSPENKEMLDFLVDAMTGKVSPMSGAEAAATTDTTEAGEGPNDADSGNEDAD